MTRKTGILFLFFFSILVLVSISPWRQTACAGNQIADQTCDAGVWNAMAARARLETEREIMQNQNLIFKADSILSYVCFDSFAGHAAENVGAIFSNANRHMNGSMNSVVINSMNTYITSNFNHSLLGGRGQYLGLDAGPPQVASSQPYACQIMNNVWERAKCMNFMHTAEFVATDGFYPFIDLAGVGNQQGIAGYQTQGNIRDYPSPCGGSENPFPDQVPPGGGQNNNNNGWLDFYRYSRNEQIELYVFQANVNTTFAAVNDLTVPASNNQQCAPAIPTGVQVMRSSGTPAGEIYADGVCTNPGCSYVRDGTRGRCTSTPQVVN